MHEEFIKYLKSYKPNDVIIHEGDPDHSFYCLLQGKIGILKGLKEKTNNPIKIGEISEKGGYFGEMSCLLDERRTASIIAINDVKLLQFPGEMLSQMIVKQPKLGLKLCTALADRLKGTTLKQQDVTMQRNEIRDDATQQFLHAKESYQKIFIMLTAAQTKLQLPLIKSIISFMGQDRLLQGGRKIRFDASFLEGMPTEVVELIKKAYADLLAAAV